MCKVAIADVGDHCVVVRVSSSVNRAQNQVAQNQATKALAAVVAHWC